MPPNDGTVIMEGVRIIFRNFSGKKDGPYNREGERNFAVLLDDTTAHTLSEDGWNVKWLRPKEGEEEEPAQAFLPVAVKYDFKPPRIVVITDDERRTLEEHEVEDLDSFDIENVDLIVRPFAWSNTEKSGIKAYLKSMFVTIEEDYLERKYKDLNRK